ncbi:hypothetical protein [Streptomyces sp. CBG30]|nr:hypothetical protein [Streptomyces sp. CBG30]
MYFFIRLLWSAVNASLAAFSPDVNAASTFLSRPESVSSTSFFVES